MQRQVRPVKYRLVMALRHMVSIVGPDGAPWITDGGLNAIVHVDPNTEKVKLFALPGGTG
jgi:streptogramin lyase